MQPKLVWWLTLMSRRETVRLRLRLCQGQGLTDSRVQSDPEVHDSEPLRKVC